LCGQHCLNNALQSQMFDAVDLSTIAKALDEKERLTMAEKGTHTKEYLDFVKKPSSNFDDSGYFSVQVLFEALKNVNLELINWQSVDERAIKARKDPTDERLYICHMNDHWFALRRFGPQWINLNSTLSKPELVTDTYFAIFLQTVQNEGYTIFVVFGELPECDADVLFTCLRRGEDGKYIEEIEETGHRLGSVSQDDQDEELQRVLELSMAKTPSEAIRMQREQFLRRLRNPSDSGNSAS